MNKEDNRMFYKIIGNSIQENKDRIEKLEKQNVNYKKAKKKLQQENKQLKNNWNKLKEWINEDIQRSADLHFQVLRKSDILEKMQELENNKNIVSLEEFNSYIDATEEDEYMWGDSNE